MPENIKEKIRGKIILQGSIKTLSPLHIGSGSDERSDMDVLLDDSDQPYIPATSFIGVLKRSLELKNSDKQNHESDINNFWGYIKDKDGRQSCFCCSDLVCSNKSPEIVIRDGIKIDDKTGIVEDKGKYDYEIVERGAVFDLNMEFTFTDSDELFVKKMVSTIYEELIKNNIKIGAKTNNGLGEIQLVENDKTAIRIFDFSQKKDVYAWLVNKGLNGQVISKDQIKEELGEPFKIENNRLVIDACLRLKNSVIIRSYSNIPEMPDSTHIKSLDDWVLTGATIKGAIRARANRIVNTLGKSEEIIKGLFGYVDDKNRSKNAIKGHVRVRETVLPKYIAEQQTRIKIDRFTGGTINAALFDSMPLFVDFNDKALKIEIIVESCNDSEAGLLLLVLKDLWTGDLAVGGEKNIGRGVFEGLVATLDYNNSLIEIDKDFGNIAETDKKLLESYVTALNQEG